MAVIDSIANIAVTAVHQEIQIVEDAVLMQHDCKTDKRHSGAVHIVANLDGVTTFKPRNQPNDELNNGLNVVRGCTEFIE